MLALATCRDYPALAPDDQLLLAPLAAHGLAAAAAVWSDPSVDWAAFDAVVIRSCWDYHHHVADFLAWLDRLEREGIRVWNPPALVRWNAAKTYLRELREAGVPIIPTRFVEGAGDRSLGAVLAEEGWDTAVVKPMVSASAHETWCTSAGRAAADEARFRALAARGALVQRFEETIVSDGEWSLLYIGGEYSHAVRKRPRAGDFRVQAEHGGTFTVEAPPRAAVCAAADVLAEAEARAGASLYARVDGCLIGGRFVLMELELIEPLLFFGCRAGAAEAFARAVAARVA